MYTDVVLGSELLKYIDDTGVQCNIEVFFLIDEIRAYASFADDEDEIYIGLGIHPNNMEFAVHSAINDLLNKFRYRNN